jgi:hypothetical protein
VIVIRQVGNTGNGKKYKLENPVNGFYIEPPYTKVKLAEK